MTTKNMPLALLTALAVLALAAGCGSDDEPSTGSTSGNAADAAFVTDMTAHHEGAIQMARIARKRAEHAEIRNLADDIIAAQKREITTMNRVEPELPKGRARRRAHGHERVPDGDGHGSGEPQRRQAV
jgi:predicted outer membrane protein